MTRPAPVPTWWQEHSLTIVSGAAGTAIMLACIPLAEGTWFDLLSGVGNSLVAIAIGGWLSGRLREVNKPEDPT